ncbi:hypothetical protein M9H77_02901 [Catharanthus roseus]|uniref:Uncharacterized protein n=1 Tax=Catharanthus roseus TaxID=4058 RepID=A0ACC0CA77_CATRO|nr:hypothetical protein M9H77_02901 [Catharanthus roseus]
MACSRFEIQSRALDRHRIIPRGIFASCRVNFAGERRLSIGPQQVIKFTTFNSCCYSWDEENQVWIAPFEEDRLLECNLVDFHSIKKTTQTSPRASSSQPVEDDDEADESNNPSDDEQDEAGTQNMFSMNAFRTEMRIAFEQLWINQET